MPKIRRMFPGALTSSGFFHLHDNIIHEDRNMLYIIKGMPGGGKSSMMKEIGERAFKKGYDIEYHHCPSDPNSVDGVVIDDLKIALVDGTSPHVIEPKYPGLTDQIIDLAQFIDMSSLKLYKNEIITAKKKNKLAYDRAFSYFKSSKYIHDLMERERNDDINKNGINKLSCDLQERIFNGEVSRIEKVNFKNRYLFSAAYTPEGFVDYTSTILDGIKNRYYLKGDSSTEKTTLFKWIINRANLLEYHIEIFYNPMIPSEICTVIIKELNTIISTSAEIKNYIYTLIDLNEYLETKDLEEDLLVYNMLIDRGMDALAGAKDHHEILETSYKRCIDYKEIDQIREEIWEEILEYM